ncbi:glycerophosphoryl diester phosphodiesterase [Pseudobutyrivibrio sp. YE44]|uniref:glycerophosphodiester phosphodiesterase n=1 Tax=Pseudobutyrivibrio sp. YE44 TaxID=1520802 RepID=UPI00088069C2|nr:glycerophosphodiester phosphodiesterase family protein [Pseudobutyrivibrio sp. YE44]SDB53640.1 glycerophosphoryl diester phosphodiesterase [Pseudobutyrivibrio sp. YE44]
MRGKYFSKVGRTVAVSMVALLCSVTFLNAFYYLPANADEDMVVQLVAHRGYSGAYPENTLSAFAGAYACGAKTVEFDVRKTKDGQLVIYHDETLQKINGEEDETTIADHTYEELLQYDAGEWYDREFRLERIPTLDQTLSLLQSTNMRIFCELKDIGEDQEFAAQVYDTFVKYDMLDKVIFLSFKYDYLEDIKEINPDQPIMKLASFGKSNLPEKYPAEYYGINMKTLTPRTVAAIHEAGAKVYCYTPETKGQMLSLQRLGVDGVITDNVVYQ